MHTHLLWDRHLLPRFVRELAECQAGDSNLHALKVVHSGQARTEPVAPSPSPSPSSEEESQEVSSLEGPPPVGSLLSFSETCPPLHAHHGFSHVAPPLRKFQETYSRF